VPVRHEAVRREEIEHGDIGLPCRGAAY
jgi:hypothetical protein